MATSQKLTEEFLTCTVCTEVFRDPCSLNCNHTFCRPCVVGIIQNNSEAVRTGAILCPTCRRWTKVADPSKPLEKWTDSLKSMYLIQGLLDSFGPDGKDTDNCSWCKHKGETTPAVYWCQVCDDSLCSKCLEVHKNIPTTRHHEVDEMSQEVKVSRKRKITCKGHPGEILEYNCEDCEKVFCHRCFLADHRTCKIVVEIPKQMEKMKQVLEKRGNDVSAVKTKSEQLIDDQKKEMELAITREKDMRENIIATRDAGIKILNKKSDMLLEDLRKVTQEQLDGLRSSIKTGELELNVYKQERELLEHAVKSESEMDVFELYQKYRNSTDAEDKVINETRQGEIIWKKNTTLLKSLEEIDMGEIVFERERNIDLVTPPIGQLDLTSIPVLENTIKVCVAGESRSPWVRDVVSLDVGDIPTVVVTDFNNHSVKSFFTRNTRPCHSKLTLDGQPWGLTLLQRNHVAVTVPGSNQITMVEVNPDLKLLSTIKTKKRYLGITALTESKLAAGCEKSKSVDIIDMTGNILKSISPHINNKPVFKYPWFLSTTREGNIVVSNTYSKSLVCVSQEGDVVFNYTGPGLKGGSAGVLCINSGDILVADRHQHSVLHLNSTGQFVREFLSLSDCEENYLLGLHVDKKGRLYVCVKGGGVDGVVRVYRCER